MELQNYQNEEGYTEVFAWGADRYGQLGLGNKKGGRCYSIPKFCTFNVIIRRIACGEEHSAFITQSGSIYTMGSNADGRLGIGDMSVKLASTPCLVEDLASFKAAEIACGWGHTAVALENGSVFTWGVGDYGALGLSDCSTQWRPAQVVFKEDLGIFIRGVSCGTRHTAMIDSKGRLLMCGAGDAGQLGFGSRERKPQPSHVSAIKNPIISAACGIFHTLVLTASKTVLAMGGNNFGQLGIGNKRSSLFAVPVKGLEGEKVTSIAAGHISAAVTEKGTVYVWGTGVFGEYLLPTPLKGIKKPVKKVEVGGNFGAAIDFSGTLYTWGSNTSGELGMGDYEARAQGFQVNSMQGRCVEDVSCGGSYAIALGKNIPHKYIPTSRGAVKDNVRPKMELEKELEMSLSQAKVKPKIGTVTTTTEYKSGLRTEMASVPEPTIKSRIDSRPEPQTKYENNNHVRVIEEMKQKIASPPRIENQYDEMLETYKNEQKRCRDLRKRVTELQKSIQDSESRIREVSFRDTDKRYQSRLVSAEQQLITEKEKSANLLRELDAERMRTESINPEQAVLESKANELEVAAGKLRQENLQMQQEKNPTDNLKVSALLKDYEDRIEQEIEDRRRISKEKASEIRSLQDEVGRNENVITKLQGEKTALANSYMDEIQRLEFHVNEQKKLLDEKLLEKDELLSLKKSDLTNIDMVEDNISKVNSSILDLELHFKSLLNELEDTKQRLLQFEKELKESNEENINCLTLIQNKEMEYSNTTNIGKDNSARNLEELKRLQDVLEEKNKFNNELQELLLAKVVDIDTLNKDVKGWTEVANRARGENTDLKKLIEDLETKNKKLMESMNLHIYNRAAEYKQRTIKALKASQLPDRLDKLRSTGYGLRHVTPSPERFEKFLEEEKKSTSKGVDNVVQLTRFRADTVETVKNKRQGLRKDLKTPEQRKLFDGKFVVDQVDYGTEEDPQFVKSNYVLVQMLDQYNNPNGQQRLVTAKKEIFATPEGNHEIAQSSQGFSVGSLDPVTDVYATPDNVKLKGNVSFCGDYRLRLRRADLLLLPQLYSHPMS